MTDAPPVVLVDLDGTLLRANSYHVLLLWLAARLVRPGRGFVRRNRRFWSLLLARATHRSERVAMKQEVQALLAELGGSPALLVRILRAQVDPAVLVSIDQARDQGAPVVLATAALPEYALPLAAAVGHPDAVCTTAASDHPWTENLGAAKRDRVCAHLAAHGLDGRRRVLLSDHPDDLPLAEVCDRTFWVARRATKAHWTELLRHGEPFEPDGFRGALTAVRT
jgi:phosphoserine phosphatase